ncbi:MAG TPA: aspartate-semialdehyde dehydrogenase [bacterium]|nr:aspartate-semialdehyde dehydrogenase [bacterium]
MNRKYNVAVVGAGLVGKKMVEILLERNFPIASLKILATRQRQEIIAGRNFSVEETTPGSFKDVHLALFAGTEGEKGASKTFARQAVAGGTLVIDNGSDFRMEPDVPLVVPEVNKETLQQHHGLIANPNCSTIQMVMVLAPLEQAFGLKRVIVSTYQAVSGTGREAVEELQNQIQAYCSGRTAARRVYPHPIAFNVFPHIGSLSEEFPGYYTEEVKMIRETRKIMNLPDLPISATCVRVPVFNGHCESLTVELKKPATAEAARQVLREAPGVSVLDAPEKGVYPVPVEISGKDDVFVGRIRSNPAFESGLDIWVAADNIRKGAALNAVQIAEELLRQNLL